MTDSATNGLLPPSYGMRLAVGRATDVVLVLIHTGELNERNADVLRQAAASLRPGSAARRDDRERLRLLAESALEGFPSFTSTDAVADEVDAVLAGERRADRLELLADALQALHGEIAREHALANGPPDVATRGW